MKRLRDVGPGLARYWERIEPLREAGKLGPVLWQLPERFHRDEAPQAPPQSARFSRLRLRFFAFPLWVLSGPMIDTKPIPRPGERWLSCPPYLLIAHVISVETTGGPPVVSYELQDEEGFLLESIEHALLDEGWWRTFQPMIRRTG